MKLREALDKNGMSDKVIGYTTRANGFVKSAKTVGFFEDFASDAEDLDIDNWLKEHNSCLNQVASWVNIMSYDMGPETMAHSGPSYVCMGDETIKGSNLLPTWNMPMYITVLDSFTKHVNPSLVMLGFEPGGQASAGKWEGPEVDKQALDYVYSNDFGGSLYWAINQTPLKDDSVYCSQVNTGIESDKLATYARNLIS